MKIKEAIEILERNCPEEGAYGNPVINEATRLGIEALEAIAFWNEKQLPQHQIYLSGED